MRMDDAFFGLLGRPVGRALPFTIGQWLAGALTALVVLYGAFLRFDAVTLKYGPVSQPSWLRAIQETREPVSLLRPDAVSWTAVPLYPHKDGPPTHYSSDPYTYLKYAREMRSFYAAHRREPLFPFVTRLFLGALNDQDVAVSFASAAFSVLAIVGTLALGWYAFGWAVGLGAALALAIEYDVVSWGVQGLRDDAFMCAVVLSALAMIRYARAPSIRNAALVGAAGGLACLIRITALSFVVPGVAYLLIGASAHWRERLKEAGVAALVTSALIAPFLVNCWLTYGDPLYSINVHADVYRETEGQKIEASQTAVQYLGNQLRSRPIQTVDTLVLGMTAYPFSNKWSGFAPWISWLGGLLSWAALAGLILLLGSASGRLLLVVLAGSLVPYAPTWRLIGDWRFTEHAYPFFLIAASLAIARVVTLAMPSRLLDVVRRGLEWKRLVCWGSVLAAVAIGLWTVQRVLPPLAAREALAAHEPVTVEAGDRDGAFFVSGWARPVREGSVTSRASEGERAVVRLPLPRAADYDLTLRIDPFPRPLDTETNRLPAARILINDHLVATLDLQWNPERVGAYDIHVPQSVTTNGVNRLTVVPEAKPGGGSRIRLWYVRIRPVVP